MSRLVLAFGLSLLIIGLDQYTKWLIVTNFELYSARQITSWFNLVHVHNFGAAFSFLSSEGGWQRWFFTVLTSVISVALVVWIIRLPVAERLQRIALALILGGAVGNLIDRIHLGYVIDFIDWHYGEHHWPAFNIADSAICIGVGLLIIHMLFLDNRSQ